MAFKKNSPLTITREIKRQTTLTPLLRQPIKISTHTRTQLRDTQKPNRITKHWQNNYHKNKSNEEGRTYPTETPCCGYVNKDMPATQCYIISRSTIQKSYNLENSQRKSNLLNETETNLNKILTGGSS